MSQHYASDELANDEELPLNISSIFEMARQHFIALHGREPRSNECIFDQEPPGDLWPPAVHCCPLLIKETG